MASEPLTLAHPEALAAESDALLARLAGPLAAAELYLAGSAALALYLGHRPVRDLDLMAMANRLTPPERRDVLQAVLAAAGESGMRVQVETARDGFLALRADGEGGRRSGPAVRLYYYPYPLAAPTSEHRGIEVASAVDLGLMKLGAIISRGSRRDFVDLYLLCRRLPLGELLARAPDKFGHVGDFALQALKGLADTSDAEGEPMPGSRGRSLGRRSPTGSRRACASSGGGTSRRARRLPTRQRPQRSPSGETGDETGASEHRCDGVLLITGLGEVATPRGSTPRQGTEQGEVQRLAGAEVLCRGGSIAFVGSAEERRRRCGELPEAPRLDGRGGTLVPGFVDPHTHLPWAGSREEEFAQRLAGRTYQEIAAAGGGILSTVRATREATEEELVALVRRRLDRMLAHGTTTAEAKSGYGLSLPSELKQLRVIARAAVDHPVELVPTLMAAHEVPPEHRADRGRFLDLVCDEIVPAVAEAGLARFCDVFCEHGVFSAEESRRVLQAGVAHGLLPRLHADEFVDSGGAALAAGFGALSADHLIAVSEAGIEALAGAGVTAVLLPGTSFFLMKHTYAPARRLIAAGVPVALATDCNPGSSYTESMPMVLTLAVFELRLSIAEALTGATLNAACCLGLGAELGSIEEGKRADLLLLDAPNLLHLAYHYGVNPVTAVVKAGIVVHRAAGPPQR